MRIGAALSTDPNPANRAEREVSWEGEVIEHYEMTIHVLSTG